MSVRHQLVLEYLDEFQRILDHPGLGPDVGAGGIVTEHCERTLDRAIDLLTEGGRR